MNEESFLISQLSDPFRVAEFKKKKYDRLRRQSLIEQNSLILLEFLFFFIFLVFTQQKQFQDILVTETDSSKCFFFLSWMM